MQSKLTKSKDKARTAFAGGESAVTLESVAKAAGVSPSTVSRILNGTAKVSEDKVRAVNAAVAKLGFLPNPVARSLARGRSMSIGVVSQAIDSPFYGEALASIEKGLLRASYTPMFASGHWREEDERRCIDHLLSRRVDGIILITSCLPDTWLLSLAKRVPLVLTGRKVASPRVICLDFDHVPGARLAVDYLIGQGHKRIAFLGGPTGHPDAVQRYEGYRAALESHRLTFSSRLVAVGDYTYSGGFQAMQQLLTSKVDFSAVFAANDESAQGALLALHRQGLRVPQDISLVGFDDLPSSAYTIPPLTTVHRSTDQIGEAAADAMINLIEGRPATPKHSSPTLAIRESTRPWR